MSQKKSVSLKKQDGIISVWSTPYFKLAFFFETIL